MKLSSWKASIPLSFPLSLTLAFILGGCALEKTPSGTPSDQEPQSSTGSPLNESNAFSVQGSAAFGSQCPHGFFSEPRPISLQFISPIRANLDVIELQQPLSAFTFQMDCIKMTLDVRRAGSPPESSTWEVMPDGNFYLTVNAGYAQLKGDFHQSTHCSTPLVADMWGKIDCKDIDHPVMRIETLWWTGKTLSPSEGPTPRPSPSASPSASPTPPSASPSPGTSPQPIPQPSLPAWPTPHPSIGPITPSPIPSSLPPQPLPPHPLSQPANNTRAARPLGGDELILSTSPVPSMRTLRSLESLSLKRRMGSDPSGRSKIVTPVESLQARPCQLPAQSYFHNMTSIEQCK